MWVIVLMFAGGAVGAFMDKRRVDRFTKECKEERAAEHIRELQALREGASLREVREARANDPKELP